MFSLLTLHSHNLSIYLHIMYKVRRFCMLKQKFGRTYFYYRQKYKGVTWSEIKSRVVMPEAASRNKKTALTGKLDFRRSTKLVKCYMRNTAGMVLGSERFRRWMWNAWEGLKCDAGEGWRRSVGQRNERVLQRVKEQSNIITNSKKKTG